jgi:hypothetical protein
MTRLRLQLHLSTLLVVSLLAAVLVFLNVREHGTEKFEWVDVFDASGTRTFVHAEAVGRGWPMLYEWWIDNATRNRHYWSWFEFVFDAVVVLNAAGWTAVLIERKIRRMKRSASGGILP